MDISNDIDIHPHKEFNLIQDFSSESKFERQNVIFWNNYGIETVNHYFLPKYIDENAFRIRSEYLERRNELIFKLFPNFEKTLINECILYGSSIIESNPFKEKIILDIIKVIALGLFFDENKVKSINCYLNKGEIISSLKLLCSSKGIKFKFEKIKIKEKKRYLIKGKFKKLIPRPILGLIYWFNYSTKHSSLKIIPENKSTRNLFELYVSSYFIHLSKEICESGVFYSKQWENLPARLAKLGYSIKYRHIFLFSELIPDTGKGRRWIQLFNESKTNEEHLFYEQFLTFPVIFTVLLDFLKIQFRFLVKWLPTFLSNSQEKEFPLWPLFKQMYSDSLCGPVCIQNLFFMHMFDKALCTIPKQKIGLYLQENQGWERIFLLLWRHHGHGKVVGVPHTTIPFWLLPHFDSETRFLPQPDIVAVNGPLAWRVLEEAGYQMDRCYPVEALRYQYLNTLPVVERFNNFHSDRRILLVLGDIQAETTNQMLVKLVDACSKLQSNLKIWFKPHPANSIDLARVNGLAAHLKEQNLLELFPEVDIVLASVCTSASLDAFCAGLPVINYFDPDDFNLSPLYGHPKARFVSSAEEILQLLQDEQWLSSPSGGSPSDFFWLDEELPRWTKLIQTTFAKHSRVNKQCYN